LSYNKELGDRGAKELARVFQEDGISSLILRSCNVRADGAACFGIDLRAIGSRARSGSTPSETTIPGQQRRRTRVPTNRFTNKAPGRISSTNKKSTLW